MKLDQKQIKDSLKELLGNLRHSKYDHFEEKHPEDVYAWNPKDDCHFCSKIFKQIDQTILVMIDLKQLEKISDNEFLYNRS